jgi:ATPase subunit of ABC transporter with duplicated ATPase domains
VQIITWEGGFYLFRSKKQETRDKKQETRNKKQETRNKRQEARDKEERYKKQDTRAACIPQAYLLQASYSINIECRMPIEEVGIRGIVESRIATKVSFLVSRF